MGYVGELSIYIGMLGRGAGGGQGKIQALSCRRCVSNREMEHKASYLMQGSKARGSSMLEHQYM